MTTGALPGRRGGLVAEEDGGRDVDGLVVVLLLPGPALELVEDGMAVVVVVPADADTSDASSSRATRSPTPATTTATARPASKV